jgi:hypothetical protein
MIFRGIDVLRDKRSIVVLEPGAGFGTFCIGECADVGTEKIGKRGDDDLGAARNACGNVYDPAVSRKVKRRAPWRRRAPA